MVCDNLAEFQKLPPDEQQMCLSFGTLSPPIATLPHCIFKDDLVSFAEVLGVVGPSFGWWGVHPMFDWDGTPYIDMDERSPEAEFRLWTLEQNHEEALRIVDGGVSGESFAMAIDAAAPASLLSEMSKFNEGQPFDDHEAVLAHLPLWLPRLRWAYVPLREESGFALFVVSQDESSLLRQVKARLYAADIEAFSLERVGDRWKWGGALPGETNMHSPAFVLERTREELFRRGRTLPGAHVLILGIAYRRNSDSWRGSIATRIIKMLQEHGATVHYHDPYVPTLHQTGPDGLKMHSEKMTDEILRRVDCVIILTAHDGVDYSAACRLAPLIIDTHYATIDSSECRKNVVALNW